VTGTLHPQPGPPPVGASRYDARPWLASYPDDIPADYDFPVLPVTRFLDDAAAAFPTRVAVAFLGTTLSYRELRETVDRFASVLAGLGVGKGDRVAIVLPNCPQNVIAFYAALRLGAVVVEHNPLYTAHEMGHQLADCGAEVAIVLDRMYETVAEVRAHTSLRHVVVTSIVEYLPRGKQLLLKLPVPPIRHRRAEIAAGVPKDADTLSFVELLRDAHAAAPQVDIDPGSDLALLQYTGGTTGLSKGAMLTHANLVANAYQGRLWLSDARAGRETTLAVLPLFHAYGLTLCMSITVLLGGTLVLLPKFELAMVLKAIDRWRPTIFPGVPPIYKAIIDSPESADHDLRSIRACVSGAMKLPLEIQQQFEQITGGKLVEGYGMTEASPITHANPLYGRRKIGTIGIPVTGTHCRIVDQDDPAVVVPPGQPGELLIRGPQVMRGYWRRPDDTADAFTADGYLRTGDIAVMDDDGFFTIVDRRKELIIAGGFNVYPSEVEEVLYRHPAIADCAVAGVPDPYRGETVKAYVVVKEGHELTEAEVLEHCRRELTGYKVPKLVEFRSELPRSMVGKVLRRVLIEEERAKLS
jgi:long-chain acyl-CoA synthetase